MQQLTKFCPVCREWVFHIQGLCPKCNHIFPMDAEKQSEVEVTHLPQEKPKLWSEESEEHQEEQSVFEKYAPWNEQLLNPWEKDPLEWNPWESNNDVSNNDPWSNPNDPFNNNNNGW